MFPTGVFLLFTDGNLPDFGTVSAGVLEAIFKNILFGLTRSNGGSFHKYSV
jgi:hypothetical protein